MWRPVCSVFLLLLISAIVGGQRWTSTVPACILGHDDITYTNISDLDTCRQLCLDTTTFQCSSTEYRDGECHLSRYSQLTLALLTDYQQPCTDVGWMYTEVMDRDDCLDTWTDVRQACIEGHNVKVYEDVTTIQDCKDRCIRETDLLCLSFDYHESHQCKMHAVTQWSVIPMADYKQPCPHAGHVYAERVDLGRWTHDVYACIRSNNARSIEDVQDIEECKTLCMTETTFLCLSIDYSKSLQLCQLCRVNLDTVIPATDYTQPCYTSPEIVQYSQRFWA